MKRFVVATCDRLLRREFDDETSAIQEARLMADMYTKQAYPVGVWCDGKLKHLFMLGAQFVNVSTLDIPRKES